MSDSRRHPRVELPPPDVAEGAPRPAGSALTVIIAVALVAVVVALFRPTVAARRPWFGALSMWNHQWLTGSTLKFTRNWYREGALRLRFLMLENPRSVEFPTLLSRGTYISYPPGTLLPIHALARLRRQEPTPALVMSYNLANHLLIAIVLALTAYALLLRLPMHPVHAGLFALIPSVLVLYLPGPLYYHQSVFFTDQAVILPFALLLFTEALRAEGMRPGARRALDIIQGIILCYGYLTDWVFVFISLGVYLKRLACEERSLSAVLRRGAVFWAGPAVAIALFCWQVAAFHQWGTLAGKLLLRAGLNEAGRSFYASSFYNAFWFGHVSLAYGEAARFLLWSSFFLVCAGILSRFLLPRAPGPLKRAEGLLLAVMGMALLPCFVQIYAFKNHSFIHAFSALKLEVPFSLIPFLLAPVWILLALGAIPVASTGRGRDRGFRLHLLAVNIALLTVAGLYAAHEFPDIRFFFRDPSAVLPRLEQYFRAHFGYRDIVFSRDFEIPINPPQPLAYTMKRVYRVASEEEVRRITAGLAEPYRVRWVRMEEVGDWRR